MKNQDGGLKVLLFDLKRSNVMFRLRNLIRSLAINLWYLQPNGPCNTHPNRQSHKDTYAHTTDI